MLYLGNHKDASFRVVSRLDVLPNFRGVEFLEGLPMNRYGFRTAAMALTDKSVSIDDAALLAEPRLAIVMGNEGDGHTSKVGCGSRFTVTLPAGEETR